jgi:hypothetical protein
MSKKTKDQKGQNPGALKISNFIKNFILKNDRFSVTRIYLAFGLFRKL